MLIVVMRRLLLHHLHQWLLLRRGLWCRCCAVVFECVSSDWQRVLWWHILVVRRHWLDAVLCLLHLPL